VDFDPGRRVLGVESQRGQVEVTFFCIRVVTLVAVGFKKGFRGAKDRQAAQTQEQKQKGKEAQGTH
jgi:hypothetical protein